MDEFNLPEGAIIKSIKYGCVCGEFFETIPPPKEHTEKCLPYMINKPDNIVNVQAVVHPTYLLEYITAKFDISEISNE